MDVEQLIREVHARPAVWNQKSISYYNRDIVTEKWNEIAKACETPCDAVRCKWNHLRDHFRKEFKKHLAATNEDCSIKYESQWVWYKNLWFLGDQLLKKKLKPKRSTLGKSFEKTIKDENSVESENSDTKSKTSNSWPFDLHTDESEECARELSSKRSPSNSLNFEPNTKKSRLCDDFYKSTDDTYHFLMSLLTPLKYMPYDRQMSVRLKIQKLITEEIVTLKNDSLSYSEVLNEDDNPIPASPTIITSDMPCDNMNVI